ncbi:MAG: cytochrome-c peroxidase [Ferruginibacter sp.]
MSKKAALGERLFNEKILSLDSSISCASCHKPSFAFADTVAFSSGIYGRLTTRNVPSVMNVMNRSFFFWDGRAETLQEQALIPLQHPNEMALPITEAVKRLNASADYRKAFKQVYGKLPSAERMLDAIAAYEETLETADTKFDGVADGEGTLSDSEERGRQLFVGNKAKCFDCHNMEDFTDDDFKNIGLFNGKNLNDSGRYLISRDPNDIGKFKTPGLRNVAVTAPYMHNGMFNTLEEVVDYYNDVRKIVPDAQNIDPALRKPLGLTEQEKKDLVAFLQTLTDKRFMKSRSKT